MKSKFLTGESLSAIAVALVIGAAFMMIVAQVGLPDFLISALATLAAAFTGAGAAFFLNNQREESKRHQNNIESANKALFTLSQMINGLIVIKTHVIDPSRNERDRALSILPYLIPDYSKLELDINSLSFILESADPNILGELLIQESNFHQAIISLEKRSELRGGEIESRLEEKGFEEGKLYTKEKIQAMLGPRLFAHIVTATDNFIEAVDKTLPALNEAMQLFNQSLKKIYPRAKFIKLATHVDPE